MPTINPTIGETLRAMRQRLGMSTIEIGYAIGFKGKPNSVDAQVRRFELGYREPPEPTRRLILMYDAYGIPKRWRNGKIR